MRGEPKFLVDLWAANRILLESAGIPKEQISYTDLAPFDPERPALDRAVWQQVEIRLKYDGYIRRQLRQVEEFTRLEAKKLPPDLDAIKYLESRQKPGKPRPAAWSPALPPPSE